jgi:hypothetical protein
MRETYQFAQFVVKFLGEQGVSAHELYSSFVQEKGMTYGAARDLAGNIKEQWGVDVDSAVPERPEINVAKQTDQKFAAQIEREEKLKRNEK